MERLTKRSKSNAIHSYEPTEIGNDLDRTDLLGEYEDTELSPEEIQKDIRIIKALWEIKIKEVTEERDFWKHEAIKAKAQLGEIRILAESNERRI